jgi:virginiamycin B lyase
MPALTRPATRRVGKSVLAALAIALATPVAIVVSSSSPAQALDPAPGGFATWHETAAATPGGRAETLMSDTDGNIWYADGLSNQLVRVDPVSGDQRPFDLGSSHPGVTDMTMGPSGDIWFGDAANSAIDRLDPRTGHLDSYSLGGSFDMAFSVVPGSDGRIWFGEPSTGGLGAIAPDGRITRVADPDGAIITNVVSAPDGRLWYTRVGPPSSLGVYDPRSGAFDTIPLGLADLSGLALTHDGTLWVGGSGAIVNVTLAGAIAAVVSLPPAPFGSITPTALTAGDFAKLYFTDGAGRIGRIDLAGSVSFLTPPFAGAMPNRLAVSSIGSLWYTDFARGALGSV